jgi:dUTP pyrophosphatase
MEDQKEFEEMQEKLAQLKNFISQNMGDQDEEEDEDIDYDLIKSEFGVDLMAIENEIRSHKERSPLKYNLIHPDAINPKYNYESDSGFDLYSVEEIVIPPFGRVLVPTGICFDIPEGLEIQVRTKSGLAINQGLMVLNSPGTVDNGYNGEVKAIIFNTNNSEFKITKGMKVAQGVLCPVFAGGYVELIKVSEIKEKDRNSNGFGSTGI